MMRHSATRFRGGRWFNGEALGAWYCATDIETAIAGTVYHQTKRLVHSASEFCYQTKRLVHSASEFCYQTQMRELVSEVDAEIRDIRGVRESHSELYNPEATRLPSLLGRRCGEPGEWGRGSPGSKHIRLPRYHRQQYVRRVALVMQNGPRRCLPAAARGLVLTSVQVAVKPWEVAGRNLQAYAMPR